MIDRKDIAAAAIRIAPHVLVTPMLAMPGDGLWVKAESLQPTGSFKVRGAFNSLLSLAPEMRKRGVVTHSSGNHGQAVAYAGARLGIPVTVVMPSDAPDVKRKGTARWHARIVTAGTASDERVQIARQLAMDEDLRLIEAYDSEEIVAATGTIALEVLAQQPGITTLYAAVGGGGLISGIAAAAKTIRPDIEIVGCEPEIAADGRSSLAAGHLVTLPAEQMSSTIADGVRVQTLGTTNWPYVKALVDRIAVASEEAIRATVAQIAADARLVAEPSGALTVAVALAEGRGGKACAILGGGNVDPVLLARLLTEFRS
jgi:threonine dehydratase